MSGSSETFLQPAPHYPAAKPSLQEEGSEAEKRSENAVYPAPSPPRRQRLPIHAVEADLVLFCATLWALRRADFLSKARGMDGKCQKFAVKTSPCSAADKLPKQGTAPPSRR